MPTWSGMRKKLEQDYLCSSLRGRIQYFVTSYSKCPDHEGRAAIRLDGEEVLKSNYYEYWIAYSQNRNKLQQNTSTHTLKETCEIALKMTLDDGCFETCDFYNAFQEFDNQSIEQSINSENPLVRVFALLDRRLGKRRLLVLQENMEKGPDWVRLFYLIRMEAEGIITISD